jgi:hypothetical protein
VIYDDKLLIFIGYEVSNTVIHDLELCI